LELVDLLQLQTLLDVETILHLTHLLLLELHPLVVVMVDRIKQVQ
tara:strand:- start:308 stop:442 length:135 start_codon:yes stop_codon:yes gene_type:complete